MADKLQTTRDAIAALLRAADPGLAFGLLLFDGGACGGSGRLAVPVAPDTHDEIIAVLGRTRANGGTSIEGALRRAHATLRPLDDGARAIVLITDGSDSCSGPANAAADAFADGVEVHVVGYGQGVDHQELLGIARAGRGDPGAPVHLAERQQDLEGVLLALGRELPAGLDELCNGVDDDCDGEIDEAPEGEGMPCPTPWPGPCRVGALACEDGALECRDLVPATLEICDGVDNDCDGPVDEDVSLQGTCATGAPGVCARGALACVAGAEACQALEVPQEEACDRADNDCDGRIDEGLRNACGGCDLPFADRCDGVDADCDGRIDENSDCPGGTLCHRGLCVAPCQHGECVGDRLCEAESGLCLPMCALLGCPDPAEVCAADGRCRSACDGACPDGFVCRADVDLCVPEARADCAVVCGADSCARDEVCIEQCDRLDCRASCAAVSCAHGHVCVAGGCAPDPCGSISCRDGFTCVDGACHPDPCEGVECIAPFRCLEGFCQLDPCHGLRCPVGQRCAVTAGRAVCIFSEGPLTPADGGAAGAAHDAGVDGVRFGEGSGTPVDAGPAPAVAVGCSAASSGANRGFLWWLLALPLWLMGLGRRRYAGCVTVRR